MLGHGPRCADCSARFSTRSRDAESPPLVVRLACGPYAFLSADIVIAKKYVFTAIPQFMLARDGKVVADDPTNVAFTKQQIAGDEPTGKPPARRSAAES
jgi:hypothetical protein